MSIRAYSRKEANEIAARLRKIHADTDWEVTIQAPLFDGDFWLVTVG